MAVEKRLMYYASFDTQSSEESTSAPSTEKQLVLARELKKECESLGFDSVELTDTGIVYAYLNANTDKKMDRIGFIAHMDTASEITGANVKCQSMMEIQFN
jgi:tripeptide aminopeptidase